MQVTIARQLGLDPSTVSNFFMNARRRSVDKWKDDKAEAVLDADMMSEMDPDESGASSPPLALNSSSTRGYDPEATPTSLKSNTVLVSATPAAVVQHLHQESGMTPTAALDLWPIQSKTKFEDAWKVRPVRGCKCGNSTCFPLPPHLMIPFTWKKITHTFSALTKGAFQKF